MDNQNELVYIDRARLEEIERKERLLDMLVEKDKEEVIPLVDNKSWKKKKNIETREFGKDGWINE